ncbi:MAG: hypothetical protein DA407_01890 [Bacteroidetes bacterium]|nr:MAG: hypothetical protein DA407_01890 [Bacteroidota bacterium]
MKTMKKLLYSICLLLPSAIFAQYEIAIQATIYDEISKEPISYVNVEFNDKPIQAVTNQEGVFSLRYDEGYVHGKDVLKFNAMGYKSELVTAERFYKFLANTNKIFLKPNDFKTEDMPAFSRITIPEGSISGQVLAENNPIQGAKVKVKNSFIETRTDANGNFVIPAENDDVIEVEYIGMRTKNVVVDDKQLEVKLESDGELLEEIVLLNEKGSSDLIDLGYNGKKEFDEITYSAGTISKAEIGNQYYRLQDLLNGRLAKLNYSRDQSITNSSGFVFDIDGMIFTSDGISKIPYVDPQTIESLTVLNSLSGTHKYGTLARNGVVIIRTNLTTPGKKQEQPKSALVVGNNYDEALPLLTSNSSESYLAELKKATTFDEAKSIYKTQKSLKNLQSVPYFVEVSDYFQRWNKEYSSEVLNEISKIGYTNDKALKTLAFKLEERGAYEKAKIVYQRIAAIRPNDAQSYMSLANIYKKTKNYQESMRLYKQMLGNTIEGIDFSGMQNIITNEIQHMLAFHRTKVEYYDLPNDLRSANFKKDVRIVFEWNDPYNEFELQFVNPSKKYYTWYHNKLNNGNKMLDEVKNGYAMQEYIIDDAQTGQWIVNLKNLTEEPSLNPTYLKYTLYKNYGLENESSEVRLVKLFSHNNKITLDKFVY